MSDCLVRRYRCGVVGPLVSVLALLLGAVACSDTSPAPPARPAAPLINLPSGTLYLVAGERDIAADLYRVRTGHPTVDQITRFAPGAGVSTLTAGSGRVIVAAAPQRTDKIYTVVGRRLDLLVDDRVFGPALSHDGRLAYTNLRFGAPRPDASKTFAIVVRQLATGEETTLYESPLPTYLSSGGAWSPDGSILLTQMDANYQAPRILILAADGSSRQLVTQLPNPGGALWSREGFLAVTDDDAGATEILAPVPSSDRRRVPAGWNARAWSPDGSSLLVSQGKRVGLVSPADTSTVRPLGQAQFPIYAAAWLEGEPP